MASTCVDNPRLGRIGCGAELNGETQHCVAKVSWSEHPDGMAHVSASLGSIDLMWQRGGSEPCHPAKAGLILNEHGRWVRPMPAEALARLAKP